jgi:hypothetical protein
MIVKIIAISFFNQEDRSLDQLSSMKIMFSELKDEIVILIPIAIQHVICKWTSDQKKIEKWEETAVESIITQLSRLSRALSLKQLNDDWLTCDSNTYTNDQELTKANWETKEFDIDHAAWTCHKSCWISWKRRIQQHHCDV